jgi:hypothetical protein
MKKLTDSEKLLMKKHMLAHSGRKNGQASNSKGSESKYMDVRYLVLEKFKKIKPTQKQKIQFKGNSKQELTITINGNFSMLTNPENVLSTLSDFANIGTHKKISSYVINQSKIEEHDLSAEILLAQAVMSVRACKKSKNNQFRMTGVYPENQDFAMLIKSIGIVEQIKASTNFIRADETGLLEVFKSTCTKHETVDLFTSDKKTQATSKFTVHMNKCLSAVEKKLTDNAESQLGAIIGELIGNAEDHACIPERHWQIYGYMDRNKNGEVFQQLSIFNFGQSIAESFSSRQNIEKVYDQVSSYIRLHENNCSIEELLTVMAFQENVSSRIDESSDRGQGFTDLLAFFERVTQECTNNDDKHIQLSIVSGNVHVYFDGTYLPQKDSITGRNMIFFNKSNTFNLPPDRKFVSKMNDVYFPGVVVTLKYHLKDIESIVPE